jgi:hypothetical protein
MIPILIRILIHICKNYISVMIMGEPEKMLILVCEKYNDKALLVCIVLMIYAFE